MKRIMFKDVVYSKKTGMPKLVMRYGYIKKKKLVRGKLVDRSLYNHFKTR